jgi:phosphotransferase system enzyme I (PtsI)
MRRLTGIGVSPGIVAGRAVLLISGRRHCAIRSRRLASTTSCGGSRRAGPARGISSSRFAPRVAKRRPEIASLFDAQLLMLDDAMLVPRAADIVREQRVNAEWAVQQVSHEFSAVFDEVADPVPARAERRRPRPRRPAAHEPEPGRRHRARAAARARRVVRF